VHARGIRQRFQQRQATIEMVDRLGIGGLGSGELARLEPLIGGPFHLSGTGQVMGQQLRLPIDQIRKMLLQGGGNSRMQLLAWAAQQRAVGGVLHQRMLVVSRSGLHSRRCGRHAVAGMSVCRVARV
jgi:hypothetical protein